MLLYANAGISELEIPNKKSLVIYISECTNNCKECHTPYLHKSYGDKLEDNFKLLFELYKNYFDVVCILGEGRGTIEEHNELKKYCKYVHDNNKKIGLYIGRDCKIEEWMKEFDYIKLGSYKKSKGPLTSPNTNQILYKNDNGRFINITNLFWTKSKK